MNITAGRLLNRFFVLMLAASLALAQTPPPPSYPPPQPAFSQQELDQMLAPIALYPDPLLSQILMASTYPLEVVEAARWSRANPGYRGEYAVNAVASQTWDPSVKSLVAFPQILAMMDERLGWTERLGDAFLAQEPQVMDTVQALRRRAYEAGNLRSNDQMLLTDEGGMIAVEPVNPQIIFVPYYDPLVVYGTWWWPAYPPVYWPAWPGYYVRPGFAPGFWWGVGIAVSVGFFFGAFDWHRHHVNVVHVNNYYYRGTRVNVVPGRWEHDAEHRRGVPYRNERLRTQYGRSSATPAPDTRREFRGHDLPPTGSRATPDVRPQVRKPETGGRAPEFRSPIRGPAPESRAPAGNAPPRRTAVPEPSPGAFEGIRSGGPQTRQFSARGQGSMQRRDAGVRSAPQSHA
ncbi:MAG: DUF3300 domain-containing protein, partial [Burkholderiales bacterium]